MNLPTDEQFQFSGSLEQPEQPAYAEQLGDPVQDGADSPATSDAPDRPSVPDARDYLDQQAAPEADDRLEDVPGEAHRPAASETQGVLDTPQATSGEVRETVVSEAAGELREAKAQALRLQLLDHLWKNGALRKFEIDRVIRTVPRHRFLPQSSLEEAYVDDAIPTHWEDGVAVSSASQPSVVAIMLEQLGLEPGLRVLEVGAGTGYNAALLAEGVGVSGSVTTIDIAPEIAAEAREHLDAAGYTSVHVQASDGGDGWPAGAPYDRIILTAAASDIAPAWLTQLRDGGRLVIPLKLAGAQASIAFRKQAGMLVSESLACCVFIGLRGSEAGAEETVVLPDGRRLYGERASQLRAAIAELLQSHPRLRLGHRIDHTLLQYLGLSGACLLLLLPKDFNGRGRRMRYGVYATSVEQGPSLAVFSHRWPLLYVYGSAAAEQLVEAAHSAHGARTLLPIEQWYVEARPHEGVDLPAVPPGALRLLRPHFAFDIWPSGHTPQASSL